MPDPARRMGDLISEFMKEPAIASWMALRDVRERWVELAGAVVASHTRILTLERGVLKIEVDSSPLLAELATFRRDELLRKLAEAFPAKRVRDLKFVAGSWKTQPPGPGAGGKRGGPAR
ncbi:MAG: DUF721 domain-containing protein [Planctomycetes bacterium]|nr:DUF721 domain-containing protein [Planctomycetota bacterium]